MYVGDEIMKKTIIWVLFALLSGALLGKITFDRYEKIDTKNVITAYIYYKNIRKFNHFIIIKTISRSIYPINPIKNADDYPLAFCSKFKI